MEFPKMIYLAGNLAGEHRIVADQSEQDAAKADGFLPFAAAEDKPTRDERAELIAQLEAAGIKFDKRWSVEKLRAAAEDKPE